MAMRATSAEDSTVVLASVDPLVELLTGGEQKQ
jgi:hypothetical protein